MARANTGSGKLAEDAGFLSAALLGYEQQRSDIVGKIAELRRQLGRRNTTHGGEALAGSGETPLRRKRILSAAARERIAEAQRKRWAAVRQTAKPAPARQANAVSKRKLSPAAKKRIADAARKRWAAFRAKKAQAAAAPKVKSAGA